MRRDIKFLTEFVICTLWVRDINTCGVVIWLCGAVRNFIRDVRSFGVPRAHSAHITLAIASISRKPSAFYITSDEVALYHDGIAVYITPR